VLTFTGAPLSADLYVVGTPLLQLSHSCDNRYNDLFVRISEMDERGRSRNVSDGYLCATPDSRNVRIDWTRPRTASPPGRASGCSSPAVRIRGSPAIWAPANH
jgi:predicted acyl esterase